MSVVIVHSAPESIQALSKSTSWLESLCLSAIGISFFAPDTIAINGLIELCPGITRGGRSLLPKKSSLRSTRKLANCFCGPWHDRQLFSNIGYTSFHNTTRSWSRTLCTWAETEDSLCWRARDQCLPRIGRAISLTLFCAVHAKSVIARITIKLVKMPLRTNHGKFVLPHKPFARKSLLVNPEHLFAVAV